MLNLVFNFDLTTNSDMTSICLQGIKQLFPNRDIVDSETLRRGGDADWATADKFETFQPHLAPSELNDFVRKI